MNIFSFMSAKKENCSKFVILKERDFQTALTIKQLAGDELVEQTQWIVKCIAESLYTSHLQNSLLNGLFTTQSVGEYT